VERGVKVCDIGDVRDMLGYRLDNR
jgi:hypothetical protein